MSRLLRPVLAVCLLLSPLPVARSADPIRPKTAADLIRDLDDRDFKTREVATKKLWEIGEEARPLLEQVVKAGSLEASTRAQSVLDQLDWGIRADTPKPILERILKFRTGDYNAQWSAVRWMIDNDEEAVPYLRTLLRKEFAPFPSSERNSRVEMFTAAGRSVRERVPILLYEKSAGHAERLLELLTLGPIPEGNRDYAVYLSARGRLKEGITRLEAAKGDANPMTALYLYRATGENQKAKAQFDHPSALLTRDMYEGLLADIGAWADLVDYSFPGASYGLTAFRLRRAGKVREADDLLKELKASEHDTEGRGFAIESGAVGLLLNGRTADGLERLKAAESAPHIATDIHAARLDFTAALDLVKAGLATDNGTQQDGDEAQVNRQLHTLYKLKKARLLAQLGERDAAAQLFTSLADSSQRVDRNVQAQVVQAAVRSGFPDIAAELLGTIQAKRDEEGDGFSPSGLNDPYEALFEADADAAKHWWGVLRRADAKKNPGEQMRAIRTMLTGKMPADQVREAIQTEAKQGTQSRSSSEPIGPGGPGGRFPRASYRRPLALAAVYRAIGDTDKAINTLIEYVEQSSTTPRRRRPGVRDPEAVNAGQPEPAATRSWVFGLDESFRIWVDLGDLLSEQGKHEAAAKRLYEGWRANPENPILLYLSGRALVKAGKTDEGKRRIELAHVLPLGNAQMRGRFLEELITRGATADMRTEIDRIRECAWAIDGSSVGNVWNQVGRASLVLKDYAAAADAQQRAMHFILKTSGIVYVEGAAYVNVPCLVRGLEARDLLARGKRTEALAAADEALAMVPTHTDTIVGLVQMLDALGQKTDADALFRRGWESYMVAVRAHPKSASLKHSAAWLAAGCRRELDTAKKYAAEAVEGEPTHRGYRESLAEVSFRTGDRDKAGQIMKQLAAEDRRSWHYKRQLERYKSGATDSPLPFSDE